MPPLLSSRINIEQLSFGAKSRYNIRHWQIIKEMIIWCKCNKDPQSQATTDTQYHEIPNEETIAAMNKYQEMITQPDKYKRYSSFAEAMNDVFKDEIDDV